MSRVAVTSRSFSSNSTLCAELRKRYVNVTFNDAGLKLDGERLIAFLKGHDKAITGLETLDDAVFSSLPELTTISKYGVGLDMIDLPAMARRGIRLGWTGGVNKRSVSELVIAFAIALLRNIPLLHNEVAGGGWRALTGKQLTDRTVGIIGCGHIGKDLACLLRAFGCRVLAHDILDFAEFYAEHGIEATSLEKLLKTADVVTLHLPLDNSTENILSAERLSMLKPEAILINTARGGLVDEAALKTMLKENRLAGAAFDVFAVEPPEDAELLALANFLATPHIGGSSEEAILSMGRAAINGLDDNCVPEINPVSRR
ncbi:MAG: phosphoglycerate dehydrogenase [Rhodospirillales bacterium RIFCSPLOWO2_12_FULL_58_28]|nr:MAG: phosphoglycerate dehydrogenase [Rhodospirillales bacterium RIFCSPLOWO2_02_FULL_58_16]OHC76701.1 MAG: phosphoglycerate dehydrogenase [Rhodospirillales bacterium RIFCSPLOWO2_12_FULL_58_28]